MKKYDVDGMNKNEQDNYVEENFSETTSCFMSIESPRSFPYLKVGKHSKVGLPATLIAESSPQAI